MRCPTREDSRRLAASLAPFLAPGLTLTLAGDLGAGKTAFTSDLAAALGFPEGTVSSPTFTIVQEYRSPEAAFPLFHFDVYRLPDAAAFWAAGLDEYFAQKGLCLIEWADNIPEALPAERLDIEILCEGHMPEADLDPAKPLILAEDTRPRLFRFTPQTEPVARLAERWIASPAFPSELRQAQGEA